MKFLFLEARAKKLKPFPKEYLKKLPEKITLLTTVQFLDFSKDVKKELENMNKTVYTPKMLHSFYNGQILGCSLNKIDNDSKTILFIGTGNFHPLALINNDKDIIAYNPFNQTLKRYNIDEIIEKERIRKKVILNRFINANNIGVIVSLKYGQYNQKIKEKISILKKKYNQKNFYFFIFNNVNLNEFNNFNFIDFLINSACPRIAIDDYKSSPVPIANINEIINLLK